MENWGIGRLGRFGWEAERERLLSWEAGKLRGREAVRLVSWRAGA